MEELGIIKGYQRIQGIVMPISSLLLWLGLQGKVHHCEKQLKGSCMNIYSILYFEKGKLIVEDYVKNGLVWGWDIEDKQFDK